MVKDETKWRLRLSQTIKPAVRGALRTLLTLFGGLFIGLLTGDLTIRKIPGSSIENVKIGHAAVAALPALLGFLAGGAAWGLQMGRLAGSHETRRLTLAGMLGFGPVAILLATILGVAEPAIVGYLGARGQPIHRVFTLLFVPSTFLIAGTGAWAVGRGLHELHLARHLFWQVGLAAALTFLAVNLLMESLGWVVGAPDAAQRATMVTVLSLGNIAAALVGGAVMGYQLFNLRQKDPDSRGTMVCDETANPNNKSFVAS
jgi:hypothetical protein